jgi:hypothetical protein
MKKIERKKIIGGKQVQIVIMKKSKKAQEERTRYRTRKAWKEKIVKKALVVKRCIFLM